MANTKLDRIERDIEKTRAKILEQQKKLKDLEAQKVEEENAQIVQMVKAVHLDGTQLAAFLSAYASGEITLPQPGKSSCFFCPSMKKQEILYLKEHYPDLFNRAATLEENAMPYLKTVKGLGRSYSWKEQFGKE